MESVELLFWVWLLTVEVDQVLLSIGVRTDLIEGYTLGYVAYLILFLSGS